MSCKSCEGGNTCKWCGTAFRSDSSSEPEYVPKNYGLSTTVGITGLGKEAPVVENSKGGKQSEVPYRFDLIPESIFSLASIFYEGAKKYAPNNWRNISRRDHINHALTHIFAHNVGDTQDDHLEHAFCRLAMALSTPEDAPYTKLEEK